MKETIKKIYLSGGITEVRNYKKHFAKAEKLLIKKGYVVINPVKIGEEIIFPENISVKKQYEVIMKEVLKAMLDGCTHIYLLKEWHKSNGSMVECTVAVACGLHVVHAGEA